VTAVPPAGTAEAVADDARADGSMVSSRSAVVSMSVGSVGILSYAAALALAHLLDAQSYSDYAAAQMLLGTVGVFAAALIPMPLTHVIRTHPARSEGRRRGMAFAWTVSAAAGAVAAVVTGSITAVFAPPTVVLAVAVSALSLFVIGPVWGWMQGELMFVRYAAVTVVEVAVRVVLGVAAALVGFGAGGALAGFAVGVAAVLLAAPAAVWHDLAWRPSVMREKARWTETGDIAVSQLVVATLVGVDVVLIAILGAPPTEAAGYQALSTLAKAPVYVAAGAVVVAFPLLRSPGARVTHILTAAMRSFGLLAFPAAVVVATAPPELMLILLPERYADSLRLLPALAAAGVGYAALTMFATVLVALRAYRRCRVGLAMAVGVLSAGLLLGWEIGATPGLAVGTAVGSLAAAGALWLTAAPLLPEGTLSRAARALLTTGVVLGLLALARPLPVVWILGVVLLGGVVLRELRKQRPPGDADPAPTAADGTSDPREPSC
jgi:O-antigen/teichoic acid export membrane protein